jgi:hypothetical protein
MDELEQLLAEMKRNEDTTMTEFKRALLAMQNMDDVAVLDVSIGKYSFRLPLVATDLYWGFVQYLEDSIDGMETAE